jgi:hypothetical protein
MLDPLAVLDRFGDEEFLRDLWLRARGQLPLELAGIEELRQGEAPQLELGKRLHKLRGLIANFLEGGQAIAQLRQCEEMCRKTQGAIPQKPWDVFLQTLKEESAQLESWLTERGFPCPS